MDKKTKKELLEENEILHSGYKHIDEYAWKLKKEKDMWCYCFRLMFIVRLGTRIALFIK